MKICGRCGHLNTKFASARGPHHCAECKKPLETHGQTAPGQAFSVPDHGAKLGDGNYITGPKKHEA